MASEIVTTKYLTRQFDMIHMIHTESFIIYKIIALLAKYGAMADIPRCVKAHELIVSFALKVRLFKIRTKIK
jgi:hypothetical protein